MPEGEDKKSKTPILHTLETDTAEYVKKGGSLIEIAAEEAKKSGLKFKERADTSPFKKLIAFVAIILIVTGIVLGVFWFFNKKQTPEQSIYSLIQPILVADDQAEIIVDSDDEQKFLKNIQTAFQYQIRPNHLFYIAINIDSREFLRLIGANPPPELVDALDSKFMLAKFYLTKDWPILILKIRAYDSAFSGMIKWERAIAYDLEEFFSLSLKPGFDFQDKEIQNHDTRVLNDKDGNPLLIYSFINRNYLVIATHEEPLKEIFRRFSLPQYLND
jgi:hypothetical protein